MQKRVHQPGIEPGASAWQAEILPLNHWYSNCWGFEVQRIYKEWLIGKATTTMERTSEVNRHSLEIVEELVQVEKFPSVDLVLHVLFQRYGVVCFGHLGCGPMESIPLLSTLLEFGKKVSTKLTVR